MSTREERAARRRAEWHAEVVRLGESKLGLYANMSLADRWLALARLNERAWMASGRPMPSRLPREEWPGEVFEVTRRG